MVGFLVLDFLGLMDFLQRKRNKDGSYTQKKKLMSLTAVSCQATLLRKICPHFGENIQSGGA